MVFNFLGVHRLSAWLAVSLVSLVFESLGASGVVYSDLNLNGRFDEGEPGVASALVTNGVSVARSDAQGRYELPDSEKGFVFVVAPNGWRSALRDDNRPVYFAKAESEELNFALQESEKKVSIRALILADTQTYTETDVGYLEASTVRAIRETGIEFDFGVTLGDVVNDDLSLLPKVNEALSKLETPLYYINGNHDLDLDAVVDEESVASFEALYGPSNFAFESGPAFFIGLDDVRFPIDINGRRGYIGGLREDQFEWIENLLEFVPRDQPLVLMAHIPLFRPGIAGADTFRVADRKRLFGLLAGRPHVLFLSGHTHSQRHYFHGEEEGWQDSLPFHEYNVAAACGSFWGGVLDEEGIPVATMWDGTPPGFAILDVDADGFKTEYRPTRFPADYQIGLHAPAKIKQGQAWVSFYANVFDGHEGWSIEMKIDEGEKWSKMGSALGWDPSYVAAFLAQDAEGAEVPAKRLPDPEICFHLWRGHFPTNIDDGMHLLRVRATSPDGRVYVASRHFEVVP